MTLTHDLDLLLKYPMVLSKNHSNSEYYGYVRVDGNDYRTDFTAKDKKYVLKINEDLKPFSKQIKQVLSKPYNSPVDFLDELTSTLKDVSKNVKFADNTDLYRKVLREYSELRHFYINIDRSRLSRDLRTIEVAHVDEKNRKHPVVIEVNYSTAGDELFRVASCDLPAYQESLVSRSDGSLLTLYENFVGVVNSPQLQALFDILDEIDKNCWVLDPEKPARKDVHRRIMLDNQTSMVVTFNPKDFRDVPQIKFLGPLNATIRYMEVLNKNYVNYDPNGDVILELYNLLEINDFPREPTDVLEEELLVNEGECCICFSKWLSGKLPELVCDNASCNKSFHLECLYQWLLSLNSRKFHYEIYGSCPNCEKTIHCPLPPTET